MRRSGSNQRSWELYAVQFPSGTRNEYDFVTINTFDSLAALEVTGQADYVEIARRVHPSIPADTILRQTFAARQLVRSEVWRRLERVQ